MRQRLLDLTGPLRRCHPLTTIRIVTVDLRQLDRAHGRRRPLSTMQRPRKQTS